MTPAETRRKRRLALVWPGAALLAAAASFLLADPRDRGTYLNGVGSMLMVASAVACWRRARLDPRERRGFLLLAVGMLLISVRWGMAAASMPLLDRPTPKLFMMLPIPGQLCLFAGLLSMPTAPQSGAEKLRTAVDGLAFALAVISLQLLAGMLELASFVALPTDARLMAIAPAALNTLLLGLIVYLAASRPGRYLGTLGIFFLATSVAIAFNVMLLDQLLSFGHPSDPLPRVGAVLSPGLLGWAAARGAPVDEERGARWLDVVGRLLPYLPALGLLATLLYRHATGGLDAERPLLWLVYPLVGLFLVRQMLAADEFQRLSTALEAQVQQRSAALAAAKEGLQRRQRLEALGRLAGGVAHDFNNLLAALAGYAHLVDRRVPGNPRAAEIARAVERGAGLTRQILLFARRQPGEPHRFVPAELIKGQERLLGSIAGEGVELELAGLEARAGERVRMDPAQLEQVLVNLVMNAREALPRGGHVRIGLGETELDAAAAAAHDAAPGRYLTIEVADDGVGMTAEVQARLFEPFFTTKPAGHGAGLGLATSYGAVRLAGGFFTVASAPGRGSRFVIHLPAVGEHDQVTPTPPPAPAPVASATAAAGGCVLLVDDAPALRTSLAETLREAHLEVLVAASGEEAVEIARRHPGRIDVLVTDMVMPGINGAQAAVAIAALRPGIHTILISAFNEVPEEELPRDAVFVAKPFAPPKLLEKVRAALSG